MTFLPSKCNSWPEPERIKRPTEKTRSSFRCARRDARVCNTTQLFSWVSPYLFSWNRVRLSAFASCKIFFFVINPRHNWVLRTNKNLTNGLVFLLISFLPSYNCAAENMRNEKARETLNPSDIVVFWWSFYIVSLEIIFFRLVEYTVTAYYCGIVVMIYVRSNIGMFNVTWGMCEILAYFRHVSRITFYDTYDTFQREYTSWNSWIGKYSCC